MIEFGITGFYGITTDVSMTFVVLRPCTIGECMRTYVRTYISLLESLLAIVTVLRKKSYTDLLTDNNRHTYLIFLGASSRFG